MGRDAGALVLQLVLLAHLLYEGMLVKLLLLFHMKLLVIQHRALGIR